MKGISKQIHILLVLILIFGFSGSAFGKSPKKRKGQSLLKEAVKNSNSDQEKIKVRFDDEIADQIDGWRETNRNLVDLADNKKDKRKRRRRRKSTLKAAELGKPDYSYEESGEDHSGLNDIRTDIKEESTDIDFDEELREVSSVKD